MLIFICLVPYTTSLKSDFIDDWMANLYFNGNMLIIALLYYINWSYATGRGKLVVSDISHEHIKRGKVGSLLFVIIGLIASGCSFFFPENSSYVYFLIPVLKFMERKVSNRKNKPIQ